MTEPPVSPSQPKLQLPEDDPNRPLRIVHADGPRMRHVSIGSEGDTYTILIGGEETGGRYCLIDMYVPDGSGPPPHRHDFEESFTLLEGELELTVRGETHRVTTGATVSIPPNAKHSFRNASGKSVRMLCVCAPAGLDAFFLGVGLKVDSRTAPTPRVSDQEMQAHVRQIAPLAAKCRMELFE